MASGRWIRTVDGVMAKRGAFHAQSEIDDHVDVGPRLGWMSSMGLLLTALAVLPLAGAGWFAAHEVRVATAAQDRASMVQIEVADLVALTSVRTDILDERNWDLITSGLANIGISNEVTLQYTGVDVDAELVTARRDLDRSIEIVGDVALTDSLRRVRESSGSLVERADAYRAVESDVAMLTDSMVGRLLDSAGAIQGAGELIESLRVLESATDARQAVALQLMAYFSSVFPDPDAQGDDAATLVEQHAFADEAMSRIRAIVRPGSATHAAVTAMDASSDVQAFDAAIENRVTLIVGDGSNGLPVSVEALFADIDQIVISFRGGTASADAQLAIVSGAAADVEAATDQVSSRATSAKGRSVVLMLLLVLFSLLFAVAVASFIVVPLRRLASQARRMRDGEQSLQITARGPREVREAQMAIGEAAANLALAERQANALAKGELSHPVLAETVPGTLGVSLQDAVKTLASSLGEREEFRKMLAFEAAHDGLTLLPNRNASLAHLHHGLARAERSEQLLAVLFIDLDGFKDVNDQYGHLVGDHALCVTARRLRESVRDADHVGRLGGDEFLVIADPVSNIDEALSIAQRVRSAINQPIESGDTTFFIDASIGVALTDGRDLTADELLYDADVAVYNAKNLGRGRIELCDDELRATIAEHASLELALLHAIETDELILHYQATVDTATGVMCSMEALVRWQRPNHGMVPPGEFIEFAERSGLIVAIDKWVLRSAARQLQQWEHDETFGSVPVSVNISGRHFESEDFVANVLEALTEFGVHPSRLTIEVTESALLSDPHYTALKLQSLRDLGVTVAIDDFGTGYTSLAYLRALPFDILKIDRSFIADQTAESFVKLIIETGHLIGASITAEGVETLDQVHFLARLGCDSLQGFYFARPCQASEIVPPTAVQMSLAGDPRPT